VLSQFHDSGRKSLAFGDRKVWSSIPDFKSVTFKWKLKENFLHDKDT